MISESQYGDQRTSFTNKNVTKNKMKKKELDLLSILSSKQFDHSQALNVW